MRLTSLLKDVGLIAAALGLQTAGLLVAWAVLPADLSVAVDRPGPRLRPLAAVAVAAAAREDAPHGPAGALRAFLEEHCLSCHDPASKRGGLDLEALTDDVRDPKAFETWVKVHDRVRDGEMPPPKQPRPPKSDVAAVVASLGERLAEADRGRRDGQGRALVRRLNRVEYENTLRDLFALPGLNVRDLLPEDGRAFGFDKSGAGLDISHVQLAKYMEAADAALDLAIAPQLDPPEVYRARVYPGDQYDFKVVLLNGDAVFLKDNAYDRSTGIPVIRDHAPKGMGEYERAKVFPYRGSVGVFRHEDDAFLPRFSTFCPIHPGRYRLRISLWGFQWDKGEVKRGARTEAASLTQGGRLLGYFDAPSLAPRVHEIEVWLAAGQYIQFNPASLWHLRVSELPGKAAEYVGPGVAVDWLDVEGPLHDAWPPASHRRLFGDLPLTPLPLAGDVRPPRRVEPKQTREGRNGPGKVRFAAVTSSNPADDARRLLADFLRRAFRRPVDAEEVDRYVAIVRQRWRARASFEDAMRIAYKTALCAPDFLFFRESPGRLDDRALASRLSYFLWGSTPDDALGALADSGSLHDPATLRAEVERMLSDPKSGRFVDDFLAQWLDLREIDATTPDGTLYPEFSPYLKESMLGESRAFFQAMIRDDLGIAHVVDSEFTYLNQRMAEHYGIPGVVGTTFRRVPLPSDARRGGFLTQASILKVTANGTTTSPVKRGVWVQRKIVGRPPDPPPPNLPAIEPDVRGATTVRELLARHRSNVSCSACHALFDPPGFALEGFDVIGGRQDRYRSLGKGDPPDRASTGGHGVGYRLGPVVDAAGQTARGRAFSGIEDFRAILLEDRRLLARNLVGQLIAYATGAPVSFADRAEVERILDRSSVNQFGIRALIHEVARSAIFQSK